MRLLLLLLVAVAAFQTAHAQAPALAEDSRSAYASTGGLVAERFRAEAADWADTPHVYGGDSRRGIDCSALMQTWYRDLFGVALPRSSGEQFATGTPVDRDALRPGDLVFFGRKRRISHVGVYVGGGEFAHAASSVGVTVSSLSEKYWKGRYRGARRILTDAERDALPALAEAARVPAAGQAERAGEPARVAAAPTFTGERVRVRRPAGARRVGW